MYPKEEELEKIRTWDYSDFTGLMEFIVNNLWTYSEWGWKQNGDIYYISTGGWSGNEEIIDAMQQNIMIWAMYWQQSRRGGHYIFCPIGDTRNLY